MAKEFDKRIPELCEAIRNVLSEHLDKEQLTYAAAIGALDLVKFDLLHEMKDPFGL